MQPTESGKHRRVITEQQVKMLRSVIAGMSVAESGRRAGYGTRQSAHRAFKSLELELGFRLEMLGHPVDKVLTLLGEMTEATKTVFFQKDGLITGRRTVPDNEIKLRAVIMLLRLHGALP